MKRSFLDKLLPLVVAVMVGVVAVGCAVTPPAIEPVATPDEYIFAQRGDTTIVVGVGWWEIFGDTTLNRLVALAVENNTDVYIKPEDCIDISTDKDSFYCYPTKTDVVTKLSLATEEIYRIHMDRKNAERKARRLKKAAKAEE